MLIRSRRGWEVRGLQPTPEEAYWNRRDFLKAAGLGAAACLGLSAPLPAQLEAAKDKKPGAALYPAQRNPKFALDRQLTSEKHVTHYNNFYEFSFSKSRVASLAQTMETSPWKVEVAGLVRKPVTLDAGELARKFPLEERLYRFRCVEAWAIAVPWTGFPLRHLLDEVQPLAAAKYVRFVTFQRPEWAPGLRDEEYPWPYHEGLTIQEAANELTLLVTGLYGKPLPKQNGAPVRLIVPWKYGFKSIKSVVRIELVEKQPPTFWSAVIPQEYDFWANVDPKVPHPRWSQAHERLIDTGETVPTQIYNGYGEYVARLY
jgi:sulfoxide reductase catalytic subunit YedY